MLHWITNRDFALWRVPGTRKSSTIMIHNVQGMLTRQAFIKPQGLSDAAGRSDRAKLRANKRVLSFWWAIQPQQNINQPPGDSSIMRNISLSCLSSAETQRKKSCSLFHHPLKKKSGGGKFPFPPMSNQEKPWSRGLVQSKYDTNARYQQINDEFINSWATHGFITAISVKLQDYSYLIYSLWIYQTI